MVDEGGSYTYSQLDGESQRTAAALSSQDLPVGLPVAVLGSKNYRTIAAVLGVMKSGRFAVVLGQSWPDHFLQEQIRKLQPSLVLQADSDLPEAQCFEPSATSAECLLVLTSGSTGTSRGHLLRHQTLLNEVKNYVRALRMGAQDRVSWLAALTTGVSSVQIWAPLLTGAALFPLNVSRAGIDSLLSFLQTREITISHMLPSLLRALPPFVSKNGPVESLVSLKLGGEAAYWSDVRFAKDLFPNLKNLINGLGITEAGGNVSYYSVPLGLKSSGPLPIGTAASGYALSVQPDTSRLIVKSHLLSCMYSPGERPSTSGELLTEDRVESIPDGFIYLGRSDQTFKANGHLVSIPLVESLVRECDAVGDCCAIKMEGDDLGLIICLPRTHPGIEREIRERLGPHLAPRVLRVVDELPRLTSGKVDRPACLALITEQGPTESWVDFDVQYRLLSIWREVLRQPRLGLDSDFFAWGGTSLAAAEISASIQRVWNIEISLAALRERNTVRKLVPLLETKEQPAHRGGVTPLNHGPPEKIAFVFPGAGTDIFRYLKLAHHLTDSCRLFGLETRALVGWEPFPSSVEEFATEMTGLIRGEQPKGPYTLIGASAGGVIALETALQLHRLGEQVDRVVLLDTYRPGFPRIRPLRGPKMLWQRLRHYLLLRDYRFGSLEWASALRYKIMRTLLGLEYRLGIRAGRRPYKWRFLYFDFACKRATARYRIPDFNLPVTLIRARRQPDPDIYDPHPTLGWDEVLSELSVLEVPGDHFTHLREPHVRQVASQIRSLLEQDIGTQRTREGWEKNSDWWSRYSGENGSALHQQLIGPVSRQLLQAKPTETILEIACGNGFWAKGMAREGADVLAFDFSQPIIEIARKNNDTSVDFRVVDATSEAELLALGEGRFDAAVCIMGLMELPKLDPLFSCLPKLLKKEGRFVFTILHPKLHSQRVVFSKFLPQQPHSTYLFNRPWDELKAKLEQYGLLVEKWLEVSSDRLEPEMRERLNVPSQTPLLLCVRARSRAERTPTPNP